MYQIRSGSIRLAAVAGGLVLVVGIAAEILVSRFAVAAGLSAAVAVIALILHQHKSAQVRLLRDIRESTIEVEHLVKLHDANFEHPLPWSAWAIPARTLTEIVSEVVRRGGGSIVECGSGVSTLHLARVLKTVENGHIYSLEHDLEWAKFVRGLLARHGLEPWATVIHAPLVDQEVLGRRSAWYDIPDDGVPGDLRIDVLLVDGPVGDSGPLARLGALPRFERQLQDDALVYLDDAVREDEREIARIWSREYGLQTEFIETRHGLYRLKRL